MTELLITLILVETNGQWQISHKNRIRTFLILLLISSLKRDSCLGCLKDH